MCQAGGKPQRYMGEKGYFIYLFILTAVFICFCVCWLNLEAARVEVFFFLFAENQSFRQRAGARVTFSPGLLLMLPVPRLDQPHSLPGPESLL